MMKQTSCIGAIIGAIATFVFVLTNVAAADVPQLISFQGKLYDNAGNPLTGQYEITFRIYNGESGGTHIWTETRSVDCDDGLYHVILGQMSSLNLDFDGQYWLGVQLAGDDELSPRYRLVSAPYAFRAQVADQVTWTGLTDVPEGFADGIDDVGETGGISRINAGPGIIIEEPVGPTATVAADIGYGADKVAAGNHNHDEDYVNEGQANSVTSSMIVDGTIQEGDLSFMPGGDNDWTVNGGNVYRESGNVGIGTTSPHYKLDVQGGSGLAINAQSSGSNAISAASSAGGGFAAVKADAYAANTYGVWGSSDSYVGGRFESTSGTALEATTSSGYAGIFVGGNVGIGTMEPHYKLDVAGTIYGESDSYIGVYGKSSSRNPGVYGEHSTTGDHGALGCVSPDAGVYGRSTDGYAGFFFGKSYFSGNVGIGTEGPNYTLDVAGPVNLKKGGSGVALRVNGDEAIWYDGTYFSWGYGGTVNYFQDKVGIGTRTPGYTLDVAGSAHATSFPTSSDARFKKNVSQLTNVLEKVERICGVSFEWNETYESLGRSSGHNEIGVIAQDVEAIFPELVTEWGDEGYKAVDYGRMAGVFIEAIKELKAENEMLKQRIDTLEATLNR